MSRQKIKSRMKQLGITQRQLAQHSMLPVDVLILWFDFKVTVPYKNLLRIADLLDLTTDELLEYV